MQAVAQTREYGQTDARGWAENVITVYSKPNCVQCTATYRALDRKGIRYVAVDVTKNAAALEYITEDLRYSQAPVVVVDDDNHWSGFRPDLIALLTQTHEDGPQSYRDGLFVTPCSCGHESTGISPDDAILPGVYTPCYG